MPADYMLSKNYPNPFNPSTKIKFELSSLSIIQLNTYDILGDEISILLTEEKAAGCYEIDFDGTGLPTGRYFDRLPSGSSIETKKIVFMK